VTFSVLSCAIAFWIAAGSALAAVRRPAVTLGVLDDVARAARGGTGRELAALDAQVLALLVAGPARPAVRPAGSVGSSPPVAAPAFAFVFVFVFAGWHPDQTKVSSNVQTKAEINRADFSGRIWFPR